MIEHIYGTNDGGWHKIRTSGKEQSKQDNFQSGKSPEVVSSALKGWTKEEILVHNKGLFM